MISHILSLLSLNCRSLALELAGRGLLVLDASLGQLGVDVDELRVDGGEERVE